MFDISKENLMNKLQFITKFERLISKIIDTEVDNYFGWTIHRFDGSEDEDYVVLNKSLTCPKPNTISTDVSISCNIWSENNNNDHDWQYDTLIHGELDFLIEEGLCDEYGKWDPVKIEKMTQFKIKIHMDKDGEIEVEITTRDNQENCSDFFVEISELYESDEACGRILSDPRLKGEKLVDWFTDILMGVDDVYRTHYHSLSGEYIWSESLHQDFGE